MAADQTRGQPRRPVFDVDQPIEALLILIAHGNQAAFASLQRRMAGLVHLNIRRILRDAAQSETATQATFAEVRDHAVDFDPRLDSAQTWLLKRAHQHAIDGLACEPIERAPVPIIVQRAPASLPDTSFDLSPSMRVPVLAMSTTTSATNKEQL